MSLDVLGELPPAHELPSSIPTAGNRAQVGAKGCNSHLGWGHEELGSGTGLGG